MIPRYSTEAIPLWYQRRMGWVDDFSPGAAIRAATAAFARVGEAFNEASRSLSRWWEANKHLYLCQPAALKEVLEVPTLEGDGND